MIYSSINVKNPPELLKTLMDFSFSKNQRKNACFSVPSFIKGWENGCDIVKMITELYQWCYGYLKDYMHPYVVSGIMVLVSVGIVAVSFVLHRNMLDWLSEKWHERRQYYEVYGEIRLRKAMSVALCIVSVTFALIAGKYIPLDINLMSWWICFSVGLNLLYHGCCKNGY